MSTVTAQGRRGRPLPPPVLETYVVIYEAPAGLRMAEVVARSRGEAVEQAFRADGVDEALVTNARPLLRRELFTPVQDMLTALEVRP